MKALAVTAGIVFWTLVLGTAWLAFFPGSQSGEPVAILQIEPASDAGAPPGMPLTHLALRPPSRAMPRKALPPLNAEPATPRRPSGQTASAHGPSAGIRRDRAFRSGASPRCRAWSRSGHDCCHSTRQPRLRLRLKVRPPSENPDQHGAAPASEETASTASNAKTAA